MITGVIRVGMVANEKIFLPQSHGYRPDTDAHAAVRKAEAFINSGYHCLVDADIEGFFDHVDHKILMDLVCEQVSDGRVLSWIESILKSGIMNEGVFEESKEDAYRRSMGGLDQVFPHERERDLAGSCEYCARNN